MELLDLQQHKTTIYITTGFTTGFMILLTCLSKKAALSEAQIYKNTLHSVGFSEEEDELRHKVYSLQQALLLRACNICY